MTTTDLPGRTLERVDRLQRRHPLLAVPFALLKKFGDDRGGQWAALVAYYGFFSLFPLLLVFTTLLSFAVQDNPELRLRILDSALSQFPIIGDEIERNLGHLEGSVVALVIGIVASLWAGMGVVITVQGALNDLWDVPRRARPNFLWSRLRALLALIALGVAALAASVLAGFGTTSDRVGHRALAFAGTFLLNVFVFGAAFRYLTVARVRWRQILPGALVAAAAWMALLVLGSWLVDRQLRQAEQLYGFFAFVLGLLSWIYLGAQVMLLSAEMNVVLARRLWPRGLRPPLTEVDRLVLSTQAEEAVARAEQDVHVHFHDLDPLDEEDALAEGRSERDPPHAEGPAHRL
ncbi:MAG: YihY/virulence factor BrkB family protein [Actinomycetota bacterium]